MGDSRVAPTIDFADSANFFVGAVREPPDQRGKGLLRWLARALIQYQDL